MASFSFVSRSEINEGLFSFEVLGRVPRPCAGQGGLINPGGLLPRDAAPRDAQKSGTDAVYAQCTP